MIIQRLNLGDTGGNALRKLKVLYFSGAVTAFEKGFNEYCFNVNSSVELVEEIINIV